MSFAARCAGGEDGESEQGQVMSLFGHSFSFSRAIVGVLAGVGFVFGANAAEGSLTVGFEQPQYEVGVGQAFSMNVVLPPLPNGLFSYGIRLNLPAGKLVAGASDAAVVPLPINFNGTVG